MPLIKAGLIRAIAVVNPTRLPEYPDLPTMAEVGYAGIGTLAWQGMFAPAGTPKPVLETLHKAVLQALDSDSVKQAFAKQYFNLVPNKSIEDAKAWLAAELSQWKKIADDANIDLEN